MSELEEIRARIKTLITTNCNTVGCHMCSMKWEKDEDGNSCQSDYLMDMEHAAEQREKVNHD